MKKWMLSTVAVLIGTTAMAQISFYGEWCRKNSGELESKVWHTPTHSRSEYYGEKEKTGKVSVTIFDLKAKKAYIIDNEKKTCMVMEEIDKLSTNRLVGYDIEVSKTTTREFLGMEEIDGKQCAHYYVKTEAMLKTGKSDGAGYNEWIYEPMKASNYNGCLAHDNNIYFRDRVLVLRNIRMGAQPDHLFKVPEGYKMIVIPAGGLLEMMTGKPKEQNTKTVDSTVNSLQQMLQGIQKKANDTTKSQEEKMKSFLEMLGGMQKK